MCQGFIHFQGFLHHFVLAKLATSSIRVNPSNTESTFVQSTRTQRFWKTIETLSCWYSLDSSCRALSDEYPYARVLYITQGFLHHFVLAKLATSSIRVEILKERKSEQRVRLFRAILLGEVGKRPEHRFP